MTSTKALTLRLGSLTLALLALVSLWLVVVTQPASATDNFSNSAIADQALARVGQTGGQCKQFANDIARLASGGTVTLVSVKLKWPVLSTVAVPALAHGPLRLVALSTP